LPNRFQTADDMPMSLGKAIALEIGPKPDPLREFEDARDEFVWVANPIPGCMGAYIDEANSQQFKGPAPFDAMATYAQPSPPAAQADAGMPKFKVGDRVVNMELRYLGPATVTSVESGRVFYTRDSGERTSTTPDYLELVIPEPKPTEAPGGLDWLAAFSGLAGAALVPYRVLT
jgi:hypothetical protein